MASDGTEHHRIEGFMGVEDYLAELELGLAKLSFDKLQYNEAETKFRSIYQKYPYSGAGPQAAYWAGVSAYKATNKPEPLVDTAKFLKEKYPENEWARKASVWLH